MCVCVKKESEVAQLCPTLCTPVDCSLPSSSVHGILQARILERVSISFSRGSSRPRDWTWVFWIAGRHFTVWATREAIYVGGGVCVCIIYIHVCIYVCICAYFYICMWKKACWKVSNRKCWLFFIFPEIFILYINISTCNRLVFQNYN